MHPIFLKIGDFVIYWYGVMVAIGILVSCLIFQKLAKEKSYSSDIIEKTILIAIISGLIGGRLLHVIVNYHYYLKYPIDILKIRNGGLAIEGAIILALISLVVFLKKKKLNVVVFLDMLALCVTVGQAIGRIGCFLNGCCYGEMCTNMLGVKFPFLPYKVFPTELLESLSCMVIFLILYLFYRENHKDGEIIGWYFILYGSLRYELDTLRGDLIANSYGLYTTQIYGIVLFLIGAFWIFHLMFYKKTSLPKD